MLEALREMREMVEHQERIVMGIKYALKRASHVSIDDAEVLSREQVLLYDLMSCENAMKINLGIFTPLGHRKAL